MNHDVHLHEALDQLLLRRRPKEILTVIGTSLCLGLVGWMRIVGILKHLPED